MQPTPYSFIGAQGQPDPAVERLVRKHQQHVFRKPISAHNQTAFARLMERLADYQGSFVLDSGCGTGISTLALAQRFPDALTVGFDRSEARLQRNAIYRDGGADGNVLLLRCDAEDLWRLLSAAGVTARHHFLFYPNPYPKARHVKRRWHAHPVFPAMMRAAESHELRCNWLVYAEEFALAARTLGRSCGGPQPYVADEPITLFEKKYLETDTKLYRVVV